MTSGESQPSASESQPSANENLPDAHEAASAGSAASAAPAAPAVLTQAPVLAHLVRGGFVESVHRASVVVTGPDGSIERIWGEATSPTFPRSSNKPLQALAMVRHGLDLPPHLLALACASHNGEPFHLQGVRDILASVGLTESALQNTPDRPLHDAEREAWIRAGRAPESIGQNCSGKHAAMLATCVINDWDTATYREINHPLQQAMANTLGELAGEPIDAIAVDGCGAPVMAVSLSGLARAFGALAGATSGPEQRIADAIRTAPEFLGGTGRDVTALISGTPGLIAKDGAESVYAVGLADGRGIALKVADGGPRARPVILAAVMRSLGIDSEAYEVLEKSPVLGHGQPVGSLVAVGIE